MDAAGFFRDATPAVNSRMTGLVALMAAATSMKKMYAQLTPEQIKHPVAFVALSGEDFGKLGSDRIMRELIKSPEHSELPGLAGRKIRAIIELGPLGFSESFVGERTPTIYVHGAHEGNMLRRMQMIADTFEFEETAELGAPKVMETSASTFSLIQADDFESAYLSEDPDAPIDALSGTFMDAGQVRVVNVRRMESVVHVIARLIRQLALTDPNAEPHVDIPSSVSAVNKLSQCLTSDDFGLSACERGNKYLAGGTTKKYDEYGAARLGEYNDPTTLPTRYPETLVGLASDAQSHVDKSTLARFVWNYLAEATSSTISPRMCDARGACTNGTVCVGHSSKNVGECHASTTKYVVALSTRLSFDAKSGAWSVRGGARDAAEKNAPLWTESNWSPSIGAALVQPGSSIAWAKTKNIMLACAVLTLALFASLKLCGKRTGAAPRRRRGARAFIERRAASGRFWIRAQRREIVRRRARRAYAGAETDAGAAETDAGAAETDARAAETDARAAETDAGAAKTDAAGAKTDGRAAETDARAAKTDGRAAETGRARAETQTAAAAAATVETVRRPGTETFVEAMTTLKQIQCNIKIRVNQYAHLYASSATSSTIPTLSNRPAASHASNPPSTRPTSSPRRRPPSSRRTSVSDSARTPPSTQNISAARNHRKSTSERWPRPRSISSARTRTSPRRVPRFRPKPSTVSSTL